MDKLMTRTSRFLAVGGAAAIVFGVIVLLWPGISLVALTALFGSLSVAFVRERYSKEAIETPWQERFVRRFTASQL